MGSLTDKTERIYRVESKTFNDDTAREMYATRIINQVTSMVDHATANFTSHEAEFVTSDTLRKAHDIIGDYSIISDWIAQSQMIMNRNDSRENINDVSNYLHNVIRYLPEKVSLKSTILLPVFIVDVDGGGHLSQKLTPA